LGITSPHGGKTDGSWRPCGDFRRLNLVTMPDSYPLPNMMDFSAKTKGCSVFSKIDLRKGYFQIPMHAADIEKRRLRRLSASLSLLECHLACETQGVHSSG
jgi:hypothetical protein